MPLSCWLLGAITIIGSLQVGIGWAAEGPQSGFFPFWVGADRRAASVFNFVRALRQPSRKLFAEWGQIAQVLKVVCPMAIYVSAVPWLGIYLASSLLIAGFMRWLGRYGWRLTLVVSLGLPIAHLRDVREMVPGVAAQGADRGPARALESREQREKPRIDGRHWRSAPRLRSRPELAQPALMFVGIVLGVIIGVLPGLGGANGVAILLPLTFSMPPTSAIILLSCIYWGALFGGVITSILFNIPGEPWSVATTFDGHPMAQKGKAGEALTAAFTSSFVGALFAVIVITLAAPLVASFALQFGPAEKFSVFFLAFCSFIGMGKEPPAKTIASMMLGFALAAVGTDTVTGQLRLTFGSTELLGGFDFLVAVIGLFGIGEILLTMEEGLSFRARPRDQSHGGLQTWKDLPRYWMTSLRSCVIGCWMGITPGRRHAGLVHELRHRQAPSKNGDKFGTGEIEGVIAPETAAHAAGTSALLPMLALGVPGRRPPPCCWVAC